MKPSLVIMAAGMGSRYGGLKQMEAMGPNGAAILDYSIYDALQAGFGKVVFIIRKDLERDFRRLVGKKWEKKASVRYVFQELDLLPRGFRPPPGRRKPWGTGHAIWAARHVARGPFAVINADDFYGRHSFQVLGRFLTQPLPGSQRVFAMVGFPLVKTLSEHGTVARGVCQVLKEGRLGKVVERTRIAKEGKRIYYLDARDKGHPLKGTETVSMNMWGFTPAIFRLLDRELPRFLKAQGGEEKSEFLIPRVVDQALGEKKIEVRVLPTSSEWFGVTYPEDKDRVQARIRKMVSRKLYPPRPWA